MKIVRRILKQLNVCIGRYIIITKITNNGIFARNVGEHSEYWLADNLNNFAEVPYKTCKVSKVEFEALKYAVIINRPISSNHSKEWKAIIEKKPKIIKFWHPKEGCIYIWPDMIKQRVIAGEPYCCIEIRTRCYEKPIEKK